MFQTKKGDGFFSEVVESISDARFTPDGRYIVTRDYLTTKLWDVNMDKKPVLVLPVHDYLEEYLNELHQNDCIFDKFELATSPTGLYVASLARSLSQLIRSLCFSSVRPLHSHFALSLTCCIIHMLAECM